MVDNLTNASTLFATFGILGFFWFTVLRSGKFRLNLHSRKCIMQALPLLFLISNRLNRANRLTHLCPTMS
ncbi:hypothetical protein CTM88_09830 [Photobacterium aquimaris]|uniref:Uncharacterized protein n=1 Tax=Photobacterium aquimaris TaxID=512643 RepID=A0A2T3IL35_9GAMM|nr:hypothetical protein CTM88_09830 [Photobacterium aquimaris]